MMPVTDGQVQAVAACVAAIRKLPPCERLDVVTVLALSLMNPARSRVLFPEDSEGKP